MKREEPDVPDARPLPDAALFERRREEAAGHAVERLPEKFRVSLMLLAAEKSYKEIAEITRVSEGAVKARVCRGKALLRRWLHAYL